MRKGYIILGSALTLLLVSSSVYVVNGLRLYHQYALAYPDYVIASGPCGAIVTWSPPPVLYSAFYTNQPDLLTLRYRSPQPQTLRITVSIPDFTQDQSIQVQAASSFQSQSFKPPLLNDTISESLAGSGQRMAQVRLLIENSNGDVCNTSHPIVLKSLEWMLWYDSATGQDNSRYLAGWVTPDAPAVNNLIGRAAQFLEANPARYPHISSLSGYLNHPTPEQVREQVDAIFDTLQTVYHVTYAADNIPYMQNAEQLIKLPNDTLTSAYPTGMCVETTAIMASAVEHLGMRPYFIIVPGHAFLGVALGPDSTAPIEYWETSDLNGGVTGSQANLHGDTEYADYYKQGKLLQSVDVAFERTQHILPNE